ncbi:MAG: DUF1640 domain-containing protein [Tepidimonas ignava]|jgi:hypothetical protein|uniref:Uncharacterized protein DUF1640 n=1 Tax=Tepidimonas ignava TaxID=114249 RepID=A0A4R3L8A5_9BURK|nr:DUF1640 domain-containing protein [Tepidimonas ignava]MCX7814968.1 DUF1640 domain-containing protein [Tepidimonas ignava]TCS95388.1 uncharacterized protein DUF1640 [Tepidimonas ignava]TSE20000.1 hypothetical protein Tigna_02029 [Tepidimonas ignava]
MSAVVFDTHKVVKDLQACGIPPEQAEAFVRAQQEILGQVLDTTLTTKTDLAAFEKNLRQDLHRLERELWGIRWMLGVTVAATVIPLLKPLLA